VPLKSIPEEIRDEWERINEELKKQYPDWNGGKRAAITWTIIKKKYKKDPKTGKWVKREDVKSELDLYKIELFLPFLEKVDLDTWQMAVAKVREFDKAEDSVTVEFDSVEVLDSQSCSDLICANLDNKNPNDYIVLQGVLATSKPFVNGNRDSFYPEHLVEAVDEGQLQGLQVGIIDWNHNFLPMGVVVDSFVRDNKVMVNGKLEKVKQIVVTGVFFKWLYPVEADMIKEWYDANLLKFSMAAKARGGYECGNCGGVSTDPCDHLVKGTYHERVVLKPRFYAWSIITPEKQPADQNAIPFELASMKEENINQKNGGEIMEEKIKELEQKLDMLIAKQEEKIRGEYQSQIDTLNRELESIKNEKDELVKANAQLEEEKKELAQKLDEASANIEELQAKVQELEQSVKKYADVIAQHRENEVERINKEIKEKIDAIAGLGDESKEFWFNKFKAEIVEGELVSKEEEFKEWYDNLPKVTAGLESFNYLTGYNNANTTNDIDVKTVKIL